MSSTTLPAGADVLDPLRGVEQVFEPNSRQMPPIREYLAEVWDRRAFAIALAKSDLRGGRSRTIMGELWSVLDPIFQAALYYLLITMIRGTTGEAGSHRLIMLVSGIFLFRLTTQIISKAARSIESNKGLMLNSTFPRLLLPLAEVYKAVLDFVPVAVVYVGFHLLMGAGIGPGFLLLPLLFVIQLTIALGLGLVFATLVSFIPDMANLLEYVQRLFFFGSPILWEATELPDSILAVLRFNPLFALYASFQKVIALGGVPSVGLLLEAAFWALLLIVVGFRLFVSNERTFALRL